MNTTTAVLAGPRVEQHPTTTTPTGSSAVMAPTAWTPWSSPHTISTAAHERAFVADLATHCGGDVDEHTRSDTTAVLNALRGGLTWSELHEFLPGVKSRRLYGAYLALDGLRLDAVDAWSSIVAGADVDALDEHGDSAARLVPVMVDRLRRWARIDPGQLADVIALNAAGVTGVTRAIDGVERRLQQCTDEDSARSLSQALYSLNGDCLFARTDHVPARVGSLMPTHVAGLLGERPVSNPDAASIAQVLHRTNTSVA